MKAAISGFPQIASSTDKWLLCNAVYGLVSGNGISLPFRCSRHRKHIYFFSSVIFSTKLHKSLYLGKCIGNILLCIYFAAQVLHERKNTHVLLGKRLRWESRESTKMWGNKTWSSHKINQCIICTDVVYLCWLVSAGKWIQNFLHPQLWQLLVATTCTHVWVSWTCVWLPWETRLWSDVAEIPDSSPA